jgi:peroxin-12
MATQGDLQHASVISKWHTEAEPLATPNIFDILSHENMQSLLHPAFNHFFKWLTAQMSALKRFQRYGDEFYLAVRTPIEFAYMSAYNSLMAEHFYGMKREPMLRTRSKRVFTVLFSVLVPYLKLKIDNYYIELEKNLDGQQNELNNTTSETEKSKLKRIKIKIKEFLLKYYPYLHCAWVSVFWYYRIAFIGHSTQAHSPYLAILGQKLVYDKQEREAYGFHTLRTSLLRTVLHFGNLMFTWIFYFLQMLKWQQERQDEEQQDENVIDDLPNPNQVAETVVQIYTGKARKKGEYYDGDLEMDILPPPELPEKFKQTKYYKILSERPGCCPLCSRERTNECALGVSGFVFCYSCIFKFVKENKRCPVTGAPCTTKSIIRLYPSIAEN